MTNQFEGQEPIVFRKIQEVLNNGLHTYEPVWTPEDNPDDEIKITDETMWIPMCQKEKENPTGILTNKEKRFITQSIERFFRLDIAQQFKKSQYCQNCEVECFKEQLEQLDYMPIQEMFQSDTEEDTEEEGFDFPD